MPLAEARDIYVARTYAYVAAGDKGLAIIDVERPEHPGAPKFFTGVNDAYAVRIGMTNASLFAYVADGRNGLRVLQLTSPDTHRRPLGLQSRARARTDRHLQDEGRGHRALQRPRPRPRRR